MSHKVPNEYEDNDSVGEKGSSQKILLLVLLLFVVVFAYLYFFTSLIRPQVGVTTPPITQVAQVKQPIPPRAGQPADIPGGPVTPGAVKAVPPQSEKPGAPAAPVVPSKPEPVPPVTAGPVKAPVQQVPAKTAAPVKAAVPVPVKAEQVKQAISAPVSAKVEQAKPAAPASAKTGQATPVPRVSAQPTGAVKSAEKKQAAGSVRKATKPVGKGIKTVYALKINGDLAASEVSPMLAKLKNSGLTPVALCKANREERMHRLFFAAFDRQSIAQAEAQKLQALAPATFLLFENGKYSVYAGSYLREDKAIHERDRLFDKGMKLIVNPARIAVPVTTITAGQFADKAAADKALKRLQKTGISAAVIKAGT